MKGTILGNYSKKIESLKNYTSKNFNRAKNEFIKIHQQIFANPRLIHNECYRVFAEPDFLEGLKNCKVPFDLYESFPIFGL